MSPPSCGAWGSKGPSGPRPRAAAIERAARGMTRERLLAPRQGASRTIPHSGGVGALPHASTPGYVLAPPPGCIRHDSPFRGCRRVAARLDPRLRSGTPAGVHPSWSRIPGVSARCRTPQPPATFWHPRRGAPRHRYGVADSSRGSSAATPPDRRQPAIPTLEGWQTVAGVERSDASVTCHTERDLCDLHVNPRDGAACRQWRNTWRQSIAATGNFPAYPDRPAYCRGFRHAGQPVVFSETGRGPASADRGCGS